MKPINYSKSINYPLVAAMILTVILDWAFSNNLAAAIAICALIILFFIALCTEIIIGAIERNAPNQEPPSSDIKV